MSKRGRPTKIAPDDAYLVTLEQFAEWCVRNGHGVRVRLTALMLRDMGIRGGDFGIPIPVDAPRSTDGRRGRIRTDAQRKRIADGIRAGYARRTAAALEAAAKTTLTVTEDA